MRVPSLPTSSPRVTRRLWPLQLGAFTATYLLGITNVAAPSIRSGLETDAATMSVIVGVYPAAFAGGLIVAGRLGDRYGRVRLFVLGLAVLALTCLGAATAFGPWTLVAWRIAQGAAGSVMMPQILAIIQATRHGEARTRALTIYSACAGLGTMGGLFAGGCLLSLLPVELGWRACFVSTAALALACAIAGRGIAESRSPRTDPVHFGSAIALGASLVCLVGGLGLSTGRWDSPAAWSAITAGVLGLAATLWDQHRREAAGRPTVLPPSVLRVRAVWVGVCLYALYYLGYGALVFNLAAVTQTGLGLSPFISGASFAVCSIAFVGSSLRLVQAIDARGADLLVAGALLQAVALASAAVISFAVSGVSWVLWFQAVSVVLGVAQAWMFTPILAVVMSGVPDEIAGLTGGFMATAQQAGTGLGVALLGGGMAAAAHSLGSTTSAFAVICLVQIGVGMLFARLAALVRRRRSQRRVVGAAEAG